MWQLNTLTACIAVVLWGCGERAEIVARERSSSVGGDQGDGDGDGAGGDGGQGSGDPGPPRFSAPSSIVELNDPEAKDQDPTVTEDQLEIFFFSDRNGEPDIWRSTRDAVNAPWEPPQQVAELNSVDVEQNPAISRDGLRIWYYSRRDPAGVYFAERPTRSEPFAEPEALTISAPGSDGLVIAPSVDASELRMAVSIGEATSRDIYEMVRPSLSGSWGEAVLVSGANSDNSESTPFLIEDGSELLFHSGRTGAGDLFWAYREAPGLAFTHVEPLSDVNDPAAFESHPHLTADRRWLYFGSDRGGNTDIYVAEAR